MHVHIYIYPQLHMHVPCIDADILYHRYGAVSFGLLRKDIPENFGESAPTLYKKLAVRNVAKVFLFGCLVCVNREGNLILKIKPTINECNE